MEVVSRLHCRDLEPSRCYSSAEPTVGSVSADKGVRSLEQIFNTVPSERPCR